MESKQEKLLSRVVVNHLFLSQFEAFRALLGTLYDVNPGVALGILKAVIRSGGEIEGVLWSESVPSPAHLAWHCLGELSALQSERQGYFRQEETSLWVKDPWLIFDEVEFLLFVELLGKVSKTGIASLINESGDQLWETGRLAFRNFGKALSEQTAIIPVQSKKSKGTSEARQISHSSDETRSRSNVARMQSEGGPSEDGEKAKATAAPPEEGVQIRSGGDDDLTKAAMEIFQELSAIGLDRMKEKLRVLDIQPDPPRNEQGGGGEGPGVGGTDGTGEEGVTERQSEATSRPGVEPRARSSFVKEYNEVGIMLDDKHRTWVRKLALYHPDLLHALCTNIRRQRFRKASLPSSSHQAYSPYIRRQYLESPALPRSEVEESKQSVSESSSAIKPGDQKDDPGQNEMSKEASDDHHIQKDEFKLGDGLMNEVQAAHVEQMNEDMRAGKLARAIQHLRYLCDGNGIPDSQYRETIRMVIEGTKKNVDPRRSPRDRRDEASIYKAYEQVIASGCLHLVSATESIQDDLVREAALEAKAAGEQALPPALEKLHKRLETRRAVVSSNYVRPEAAWIDTCKMELFQYARVMQVHTLETVMQAAFTSIKALQFQKAADVLTSYPRLQPLATVMGWDLLAGKTSARRRLMEVLWAGRRKIGKTEGGSSRGKPAEEVSCVDELCDQLCYRLEVAYFTALTNAGGKWKAGTSKIFGNSKGQATKTQEDQPPADNFAANLVLERLAMHSPVGAIFDLVPNINFRDALQLVQMQPVGVSGGAFVRRQQDIELVHLSFGVQAAVSALGFLEASAVEDKREQFFRRARSFLHELRQHLEAISTPIRKVWMMQTIVHLLYMDDLSAANEGPAPLQDGPENFSGGSSAFSDGDKSTALAVVSDVLSLLRHCFSSLGLDVQQESKGKQRQQAGGTPGAGQSQNLSGIKISSIPESVTNVWERKAHSVRDFVDDWEWRLEVLQRLRPSSQHQWQWKEALGVLRASPSTLLNMCVQGAQHDLGEEAVRRYNLPTAEIATLQLAEWMDGVTVNRSSTDSPPRVSDEAATSDEGSNPFGLSVSLPPLTSVILFLDAAAASAKSVVKAKQLLDRARVLLSQIPPAGSRRQYASPIEQKQEAAFIRIAKQILQRFHDLVEQDKSKALQTTFSGADIVSSGIDVVRQGPKQRALGILHQIIEDAHNGKRQFLSGKLHNLVKALSDEEDDTGSKQVSSYSDRKQMAMENGLVLGLGFQSAASQASPLSRSGSGDQGEASTPSGTKSVGKRFLGPLSNKPTAYLSAFILYIATVGDIVDGADTTHDFNYFSLIYERPNDLLTRLVFERGNADAAGKVAEIMGQDLVHQVITACVPPVYPPVKGEGWARIPLLTSHDVQSTGKFQGSSGLPSGALSDDQTELYVLQRDVVKHLVTLSPVRAILACVFGNSRFTVRVSEGQDLESSSLSAEQQSQRQLDDDQWFYEFALEQSERFSTLHRWIIIQANLQHLSESTVTKRPSESGSKIEEKSRSKKRMRDPDYEETVDAVDDQEVEGSQDNNQTRLGKQDKQDVLASLPGGEGTQISEKAPPRSSLFKAPDEGFPYSILLDWENEGPYVDAVKGLIEEGKLVDALALADRYLHSGAPDQLLQLLIERGEDSASHSEPRWHAQGSSHHNLSNSSWQYCVRLRNKELAATLALKYFHRWELDAAIDVLTMCSCHLDPQNVLYDEVIRVKKSLQQYGQILRADSRFTDWREVEADCQKDPEGLALRLASKGAVSAALGVAESFKLPNVTRRELQGRQLVQLLTSDPTTGGGPAAGLKFLKSLPNSEDALPVAMAAMEQLPNLRSKQLLVHFFLKGRVGSLSEEEYARMDRLAIGLRMLGALPLPWQQRCSALHEHPRLILETLLMWKQLKAASQLLQAFPSLRDDDLIISYAAKAINFSSCPSVERRTYPVAAANKPPPQTKSSFTSGISSLHRRAFSWTGGRDSSSKSQKAAPITKQKAGSQDKLSTSQIADWKAMAGIPEDSPAVGSSSSQEGHERPVPVTMGEEWVLTGDTSKDDAARSSHRYESAPSAILVKALLTLCSDETVAAKAAVNLCVAEIQKLLKAEQLPQNASSEVVERGFHATEAFVQVLVHASSQLQSIIPKLQTSTGNTAPSDSAEEASNEGKLIFADYLTAGKLSELLATADMWLSRVELLQSLLGSGVVASLDDLLDDESAMKLRDRLIQEERYNTAVNTCTKCKIDALPVWEAWGLALLRIENYAQARQKFKEAFWLRKGDPAPLIHLIMQTMESGPPADVTAVRNLYLHMSKSFASSSDDSMSADAYLNVLCMPTFTKPRSRRSSEDSADGFGINFLHLNGEESIRSNLDGKRYEECVHYLQEYARQDLLAFTFRHGHYYDACLLFFPPDSVPPPPLPSPYQPPVVSSSPQRPDSLATDYGLIDDLCEYCVRYGAFPVLERVLSNRSNSQDSAVASHTSASLTRICTYCESHRHFNHLYRFQVLKKDYVAAGLCCIQLFLNSSHQDEALHHLENARSHFDEGLLARQQAGDMTKGAAKASRGKLPSDKLTEEELIKFTPRINIQMEVVRTFGEAEGPLWKWSLFGNPNDADTSKRRCDVAEKLVEKNVHLAFQMINDFGLTAVHIYAGVAASLAERRKTRDLTELLGNIKGTIHDDDWDQVLGAAINVYASRRRERPDQLIDMLKSTHRKVLAYVICGRLKAAYQKASESGSFADVQYVAHQARQSGSKSVLELCQQWLAKHS